MSESDNDRFWWSLPRPAAFIDQAHDLLIDTGCLAVVMPEHMPPGIIRAFMDKALREEIVDITRLDVSASGSGHIPALAIAEHLLPPGRIPLAVSAKTLLANPAFEDRAVLVENIRPEHWPAWEIFLSLFARERRDVSMDNPLAIAIPYPAMADLAIPGFSFVRWHGIVTRLDMALYVSHLRATQPSGPLRDDLLERTIVDLAGYDRLLAEHLSAQNPDTLLNPIPFLKELAATREWTDKSLSWENGTVDEWDGRPFVHTLILAAANDFRAIETRIWRAQAATLFPWLDDLRADLIGIWRDRLVVSPDDWRATMTRDIDDLEISAIIPQVRNFPDAPAGIVDFLDTLRLMRNNIGHRRPADAVTIHKCARQWRTFKRFLIQESKKG